MASISVHFHLPLLGQSVWIRVCRAPMALSASSFASFIDSTPTPYQLVDRSVAVLKEASFEQLHEDASWHGKLAPGGKYFFHRNQSTLVAFTVGKAYQPGGGFKIVGAHTDSPVLKLKPVSEKTAHGYQQIGSRPRARASSSSCSSSSPLPLGLGWLYPVVLRAMFLPGPACLYGPVCTCMVPCPMALGHTGVECYGGGLWHTWFDRELSVSGCCIVRTDGGNRALV